MLGGGIVPGSLVLVGGEPGIGKSTLLLQVLDNVAAGRSALLVCGEESAAQVKMRAERICKGVANIDVFAETELELVLATVASARPAFVVVDSVQTLYSDSFTSAPGSVSQVREAAGRFLRLAKDTGAAVFLVGHVTKEGAIAGPRVLEHMVDTVLQFEGDRYRFYRTLRAVKNRFGSTNELGIFEMTGSGLKTVPDPSARSWSVRRRPPAPPCTSPWRVRGAFSSRSRRSISTPSATPMLISARSLTGCESRIRKVPARMMPALVSTPPVAASAFTVPSRSPSSMASLRMRVVMKML